MRFDAEEFICPLLFLGLIALVVWLTVRKRPRADERETLQRLETRVRDLSIRVHELERRSGAERVATAPVPAPETPPPAPVVAPAATPPRETSEWIETRSAAAEEPPPLPPPVEAPAARTEPVRAARPAPDVSFETFLGGRVMLVAGVIVALFGVGFFLKYAIDREWIGPGVRVAMGVAAGLALLVGGERMRKRGFDVFGQALMGCGLGALYLSNYFACKRYEFIGQSTAFALAAAITAAGAALALARGAPLLAYLGFFGGYLAPAVLSNRQGAIVPLTSWLLVVDAGVLVVLLRRTWQGLDLMALAFTALYVGMWLDGHDRAAAPGLAGVCGCLAALVVASLAMGLVPAILRRTAPMATSLLAVGAAGALGALALHDRLFPGHRVELGAAVVGLGALYLLASGMIGRTGDAARAAADSLLGYAVAALATAIAVVASGTAVSPALSVAGVAIVFAGSRTRREVLLGGGVVMILLAFGDLVLSRLGMFGRDYAPFWNERFLVFVCPCVAMLVAGRLLSRTGGVAPELAAFVGAAGLWPLAVVMAADLGFGLGGADVFHREMQIVAPAALLAVYGLVASRFFGRGCVTGRVLGFAPLALAVFFGLALWAVGHRREFTPLLNPAFGAGLLIVGACTFAATESEAAWRAAFRITGLVYLFGLVTSELYTWGQLRPLDGGSREEAEFAAIVWISIAWAIYAAALVSAGFLRRTATLRWMGLAVFALTLGKVFLVDLAQLDTVYRIGSFLVLGALLVAASFLYQRARRSETPPT